MHPNKLLVGICRSAILFVWFKAVIDAAPANRTAFAQARACQPVLRPGLLQIRHAKLADAELMQIAAAASQAKSVETATHPSDTLIE